jgi:hypothetical protein
VTVLVDEDGRKICALNETALALWVLCDGATEPEEMAEAISIATGLSEEAARADVERTLRELTEVGVLTWSG